MSKQTPSTARAVAINPEPPKRIYNWLHSQMSIARHYGGLQFRGHQYLVAWNESGQPLVRSDVIKAEQEAAKQRAKHERKEVQPQAQGGLF